MIRNQAGQTVSFQAVNITTGAPVTTGTPVVYVTIGGVQAPSTNTATHMGNGEWELDLTAAETNGASVAYTFTLTDAINQTVNAYPVTLSDYQADVTAIVDAVWDEPSSSHSTAGTFGLYVDSQLSSIRTVVDNSSNDIVSIESTLGGSPGVFLAPAQEAAIVDSVWDESTASHATAGTFGKTVSDTLVDTGTTIPDTLNGLSTLDESAVTSATEQALTNYDAVTATALTARTLLAADYATALDLQTVDNNVDAILVDTAELQSKLIPMLEADGSGGFQYTTLSLENAPSGGGGGGTSSNRIAF